MKIRLDLPGDTFDRAKAACALQAAESFLLEYPERVGQGSRRGVIYTYGLDRDVGILVYSTASRQLVAVVAMGAPVKIEVQP